MLAVLLAAYPAFLAIQALRLPRLTDISTDIADPPAFSRSRTALDARRARAARGAATDPCMPQTGGLSAGRAPPARPHAAGELRPRAEGRHQRGWQIIETATPGGRVGMGRLEAIDHSLAMRFPDGRDGALCARLAAGTRIDVRLRVALRPTHDSRRRTHAASPALSTEQSRNLADRAN